WVIPFLWWIVPFRLMKDILDLNWNTLKHQAPEDQQGIPSEANTRNLMFFWWLSWWFGLLFIYIINKDFEERMLRLDLTNAYSTVALLFVFRIVPIIAAVVMFRRLGKLEHRVYQLAVQGKVTPVGGGISVSAGPATASEQGAASWYTGGEALPEDDDADNVFKDQ
ncbi:MAG: DUF4328 domain-containing protein, partial [Bacteroidota bacterium]